MVYMCDMIFQFYNNFIMIALHHLDILSNNGDLL